MNNILTLIRYDFQQATRNVVAAVVLVGVVLIPSFFAWFNVLSSWDPFDNVDNLKIAVASADEGFESDLFPMSINVGDTVISQLRANSDIDWQFVSEDEAIEGTKSEEYYAAIVLPPDFSKKMLTFIAPGATPVDIDLYVNEKKNALSSLITGEAATDVSTQINTSFTKTLDEVGLALVSTLATNLESSDTQRTIERLQTTVGGISDQLRSGATTADMFAVVLKSADGLLTSAGSLASSSSQALQNTSGAIGQGSSAITSAREAVASASERLDQAFAASSESFATLRTEVDRILGDGANAQQSGALSRASGQVDEQITAYAAMRDQLRAQASATGVDPATGQALSLMADRIDGIVDRQQSVKQRLDEASAAGATGDRSSVRSAIVRDIDAAQAAIDGARAQYTDSLRPKFDRLSADLAAVRAEVAGIGQDLKSAEQTLAAGSGSLSAGLSDSETAVRLLAGDLRGASEKFADLEDALAEAENTGDLSEVTKIIGNDPATFAGELASPVNLNTIPVFKVDNFGSQMAPLYSVLGLWVGALLLAVLIKTEIQPDALKPLATPLKRWQEYLGHYVIFGTLAILQATILFGGLIVFVGVRPEYPLLLMLAGWVMSFVFSLITYTLVLTFGEAGKAIGVLLLVIQISAGGGAYPLAVLPQWFQNISPFIPVSHATNAVRAAIAGMYDGDYWKAIGFLLLFTIPVLLIGLVLRPAVKNFNDDLNASLEGTKLMSV